MYRFYRFPNVSCIYNILRFHGFRSITQIFRCSADSQYLKTPRLQCISDAVSRAGGITTNIRELSLEYSEHIDVWLQNFHICIGRKSANLLQCVFPTHFRVYNGFPTSFWVFPRMHKFPIILQMIPWILQNPQTF
jgi:hypothetical protein